ncbi:unnamed protein product [Triticum turgidum subsp. durum]|uniref:NADP-dependent oxidoreductase domain-containing protein n=1 Tax=Triticum turgidum subsp. durum TaxID=4567 RepID=A0A9R1R7U1_TRITD|nr:unnamed protein product [Triticum turgidum subsp. durum]
MATAPVTVVPRLKLGSQGMEVSAQGLGCMGMSAFYGPPKPEHDMVALIHHAVAAGVTLLDSSDIYGPHTNEILLGKALLGGVRERVELATKFGISFADGKREVRGDPAYVRAACEGSLERLGVSCIDLYYQHRVDTRVPIEVTVGELKKLVEEGKIKYIGLSEASASTIRRAHAVHPITAVQMEWSLWSRDVEEDIIPTCRENLELELLLTAHLVEDSSLKEQNWLTHYQTRTSARIYLDFNQRVSRRMPRYLSVLMRWPQGKDAHHHNLPWLGFTIREAMFAPSLGQQKLKISTKMWEH